MNWRRRASPDIFGRLGWQVFAQTRIEKSVGRVVMQILVLTFIAKDRPGLVERLSRSVADQGGNWLESRMAQLADSFAGIARVEIAPGRVDALRNALLALGEDGFHLVVEEAEKEIAPVGALLHLDLIGADQPGIVRDISLCLKGHGVSVEEMTTNIEDAPMGAGVLFRARAKVRAPAGMDEDELRDALENLAAALMVDITLAS
jgi:glycine cleavage system regulatory protein